MRHKATTILLILRSFASCYPPPLSGGHSNVTSKSLPSLRREYKVLLLGVSSAACTACAAAEPAYHEASAQLRGLGVFFGRVDAVAQHRLVSSLGAGVLPSLLLLRHGEQPTVFQGPHSSAAIVAYAKKQLHPAVRECRSISEVLELFSLGGVVVIGFFEEGSEDAEFEDFADTARLFQSTDDVHFGAVLDAAVVERTRQNTHWFRRAPALILARTVANVELTAKLISAALSRGDSGDSRGGVKKAVALPLAEMRGSLYEWVLINSLPVVGELTPSSFRSFERTGLPMLMLFVRSPHSLRGRAAKRWRRLLLDFGAVAAANHGLIVFVHADATQHEERMKSLGLFVEGDENKRYTPRLAFNTRDGRVLPFPREQQLGREAIARFCADFLQGRLRDAGRVPYSGAVSAASPIAEIKGVRERFGGTDEDVVSISPESFQRIAMDETRDVLLLFHSPTSVDCLHLAPYYKRVALRFRELGVRSVVVARYDVSRYAPPSDFQIAAIPTIVLLPAHRKAKPFIFFSGTARVKTIMDWVQQHSSVRFKLGELPQFDDEERRLYQKQLAERKRSSYTEL